jgi:hypothetical protein
MREVYRSLVYGELRPAAFFALSARYKASLCACDCELLAVVLRECFKCWCNFFSKPQKTPLQTQASGLYHFTLDLGSEFNSGSSFALHL